MRRGAARCKPQEPDVARFAGCYKPSLEPGPAAAGDASDQSWMQLEAVPERTLNGDMAYRVRTGARAAAVWPFKSWWRPISADSIEIVWASGTFGTTYRLRHVGDRLEGRVYKSTDAEPARVDAGAAVVTRVTNAARECAEPVR